MNYQYINIEKINHKPYFKYNIYYMKEWIKQIKKTIKTADMLKEIGEIKKANIYYKKGYDMIQHLKYMAEKQTN